jgi:hypothetical protein
MWKFYSEGKLGSSNLFLYFVDVVLVLLQIMYFYSFEETIDFCSECLLSLYRMRSCLSMTTHYALVPKLKPMETTLMTGRNQHLTEFFDTRDLFILRFLMIVYNNQDYRVFALCPSSGILKNTTFQK